MDLVIKPGYVDGMPHEQYRDIPALAKSDLDRIAGLAPPHNSDALQFGSFFHCLVLEPNLVPEKYYVAPDIRRGTREWERIMEQAEGRTLIKEQEWESAYAMREAVLNHHSAGQLIDGAIYERSVFALDLESGLMLKSRPDIVRENMKVLADLKTAQVGSPIEFGNSAAEFRYHVQASYYLDIYNSVFGIDTVRDFIWIVVEKTPPYLVFVNEMPAEDLELGKLEYRHDIDLYQHKHQINICRLPEWYTRRKRHLYGR